jgi:hypothetical protein
MPEPTMQLPKQSADALAAEPLLMWPEQEKLLRH